MPLRLTDLRLPIEHPEAELRPAVAKAIGVAVDDITSLRILRKSLDARQRNRLQFVYSVTVDLADETARFEQLLDHPHVSQFEPKQFDDAEPGHEALNDRPIVVGSGPAGLAAGYYLAVKGYRPLVIDRGQAVKERVVANRLFDSGGAFDAENNYLFGEGGAGCFSDGKLTCRMSGPDVDWVLERFVECGGKESIRYEHRPHLGSNRLPLICRNFRRRIEELGGEYRFGCCLEGLDVVDGVLQGIHTSSGRIAASQVILGIGHSARDTYRMLHDLGLPMLPKAFQLGLRIEQPQEQVDRHKYGRPADRELLGAADYTLVARGQRDVFTFCMCAGGVIIPSISEAEMFCTNGMSNSRHDTPFANSGLMITLDPSEFGSDHPLAGVELQRKYEALAFRVAGGNYDCPIQPAADFLAGRAPDPAVTFDCSYQRGAKPLDLAQLIPPVIATAIRQGLPIMDRKWRGGFLKNAMLVGPELRGSSPVRIDRDHVSRETPGFAGLYPVGEGAGYAGGIISAAVDGLRSAREIVRRFAALEPVSG